jgi:mono/diheme cytochrome c family protein
MIPRSAKLLLAILYVPLSAEVRDLKAFYQERCAVCHAQDGTGRGPNGGKLGGGNLADTRREAKGPEDGLVASILDGKGAMPGYRRQLSEAEARRLLASVVRPMTTRKKP